ncbi:MAG: lamin tail domain-containing protein [Actinomycetota bacterium]
MAVLLVLIGVTGLIFALVNLVRPTGWLGIYSRNGAVWILAASLVVVLIGAALTPPPDTAPDPEAAPTTTTEPPDEMATTSSTSPVVTSTSTFPTSTTTLPTSTTTTTTSSDLETEDLFGPPRAGPSGDPGAPLDPAAETATVVAITDGDTIDVTLSDGSRDTVRLIGINAPERDECWASEATRVLEALIPVGNEIGMTIDQSDRDQFGRLLRYLWVGSMSVNEELVRRGAALSRRYPPDTAHSDRFDAAQATAEEAELGLWAPDACGEPVAADVRIIELRYDAAGNDNENLNDEWIRLRNEGNETVDMSGWGIKDESATNRFEFPSGFTLAPGDVVTIYSGCGDQTSTELYWCSVGSAIWNNDGDTAFLTDPAGNTHFTWAYSP